MSQSTGSSVSGLQQLQHVSSVAAFLSLERGINSCGAWAQSLHSMRDLPGSGVEPMSPALAGRFSTTEPPGHHHPLLPKVQVRANSEAPGRTPESIIDLSGLVT